MSDLWDQIQGFEDTSPTDWKELQGDAAAPLPEDVGGVSKIGTRGHAKQDHSHRGVSAIEVGSDILRSDVEFIGGDNITLSSDEDLRTVTIAVDDPFSVDEAVIGDLTTIIFRTDEMRPVTDSPAGEITISSDVVVDGCLAVDCVKPASESPAGTINVDGDLDMQSGFRVRWNENDNTSIFSNAAGAVDLRASIVWVRLGAMVVENGQMNLGLGGTSRGQLTVESTADTAGTIQIKSPNNDMGTYQGYRLSPDSGDFIVEGFEGGFNYATLLAYRQTSDLWEVFSDVHLNSILYVDEIRPQSGSPGGVILLTGDSVIGGDLVVEDGVLEVGSDDSVNGEVHIYGNNLNTGGIVYIYPPAKGDTTTDAWLVCDKSAYSPKSDFAIAKIDGASSPGVKTLAIYSDGDEEWKFGDPDNSNVTTIENDGTIVFEGDGTVWKDINLGAARLSLFGLLTGPDYDEFKDSTGTDVGVETYAFAVGEEISGVFEMQHDYKEGSNFTFHVHWQGIANPSGTDYVRWELSYTISRNGQALQAATTVTSPDIAIDTQYEFLLQDIVEIDGSTAGHGGGNVQIGDQFMFRLERVAAAGAAYAGDALLATCGIHYEIDTVGSRQITTK